MPVLLISGQDDPVEDMGKGVLAVKKRLDSVGRDKYPCICCPVRDMFCSTKTHAARLKRHVASLPTGYRIAENYRFAKQMGVSQIN